MNEIYHKGIPGNVNFLRWTLILLGVIVLAGCSSPAAELPTSTPLEEMAIATVPLPTVEALEAAPAPQAEAAVPEATGSEEAVLTIWHGFDEVGSLALEEICSAFQRQEPGIKIELFYVPFDDLQEHYIQAVESGVGPSLMLGAGEWGPALSSSGVIADVSGVASEELRDMISPPAWQAVAYRDTLTGLPYALRGVVMFRNKAIIPEVPRSFSDLVAASQAVTKGRTIGAYLEWGEMYSFPQLTACGGTLIYENGYPGFDNPDGLCWLGLLKAFKQAGPVAFNNDDDLNRFKGGNVGIIFDGTWNMRQLSNALGNDLAIDPWPTYQDSHLSGYVWTDNVYMNPALEGDLRSAAAAFMRYFLSQEAQARLAEIGLIPATQDRDIEDWLVFQSAAALSGGTPFPAIPEMELYWEPMQVALESVLQGDTDPAETLRVAAQAIIDAVETFKDKEENY
jgi:arabinogalactan oligomer/maltooligosaccharide transport system substrate-binding protein